MKREFDAQIRKVGNSYVITVPAKIIKRYRIKKGQYILVNIQADDKNG